MRVRNRRNNPRCACEHINHFTDDDVWINGKHERRKKGRVGHRYQQHTADGGWALYVGHVCKACEESCMRGWMVEEHVCGEGDCHRQEGTCARGENWMR